MKTKEDGEAGKSVKKEEIVKGNITCSACGNTAIVYPQRGFAICPICGTFPYVIPPKNS